MNKIILLIIMYVLLALSLSACYDATEMDGVSYAYTLGFDKGVSGDVLITIQIPTMKDGSSAYGTSSSQGTPADIDHTTISIDAPSLLVALNMMNSFLPRKISLQHTKYIIFSEELAQTGLNQYLMSIIRLREIRRTTHMIITKCTAKEFIEANKTVVGSMLSKNQEIMMVQSNVTGFFAHTTISEFYNSLKAVGSQPIGILASVNNSKLAQGSKGQEANSKTGGSYLAGELPREGGDRTEFLGTALFNGDKMVAELNGDETRFMEMARGEFLIGYFDFPDPKKPDMNISMKLSKKRSPKINIRIEGNKPIIDLTVYLISDVYAIPSGINYESKDLKPILEESLKKQIKDGLDKLMEKCKDLKVDAFNFGLAAQEHFATMQEFEAYNWLGQFENAEINTKVELTVERTGLMLESSPVISSEGKE